MHHPQDQTYQHFEKPRYPHIFEMLQGVFMFEEVAPRADGIDQIQAQGVRGHFDTRDNLFHHGNDLIVEKVKPRCNAETLG